MYCVCVCVVQEAILEVGAATTPVDLRHAVVNGLHFALLNLVIAIHVYNNYLHVFMYTSTSGPMCIWQIAAKE